MRIPGMKMINTVDPENIKAILATQFNDFGKGEEFNKSWRFVRTFGVLLIKFMGEGIFNVDGKKWSAARALLRPQFLKQRLSDLQIFEEHISEMISLLPKDGQTINLMEWWYRFTLDSSTHYLFGESVGSLADPKVL
jgi:cytochrome P450